MSERVQEVVAWMTEDGTRVVSAATKRGGEEDGGAIRSSLAPYCVPLFRAERVEVTDELLRDAERAIEHKDACGYPESLRFRCHHCEQAEQTLARIRAARGAR